MGYQLTKLHFPRYDCDTEYGAAVRVQIREPDGSTVHGPYKWNQVWCTYIGGSCVEPDWFISYWENPPDGIIGIPVTLGNGITLWAQGEWDIEWEHFTYRGDGDGYLINRNTIWEPQY